MSENTNKTNKKDEGHVNGLVNVNGLDRNSVAPELVDCWELTYHETHERGYRLVMHKPGKNCAEQRGEEHYVRGTSSELQTHFDVVGPSLCPACYNMGSVQRPVVKKLLGIEETDALGLRKKLGQAATLETGRQNDWENWIKWLYGVDVDQLKQQGKTHYRWNENEPLVGCFDISWLQGATSVAWCGTHVIQGHDWYGTSTHGLLPKTLAERWGEKEQGVAGYRLRTGQTTMNVVLDIPWTEELFKLTAALYWEAKTGYTDEVAKEWVEQNVLGDPEEADAQWAGRDSWERHQLMVAVETAKLCLK